MLVVLTFLASVVLLEYILNREKREAQRQEMEQNSARSSAKLQHLGDILESFGKGPAPAGPAEPEITPASTRAGSHVR